MQDTDDLVSRIMAIADCGVSPTFRAQLIAEVKKQLDQGASLTPYINERMTSQWLTLELAAGWLELGFDPNTSFTDDGSEPCTLLEEAMETAEQDRMDRDDTCKLVELLCSHGALITPKMYEPELWDYGTKKQCKGILRLHYIQRTLIALVAARVVHPDPAGVLKGFLI